MWVSFFPFCPPLSFIYPFPFAYWSSAGGSPCISLVPFLSVMWEFFLLLLRVQVLGFCEEPRGNLGCNRRCINNDELRWISLQWSFWEIQPQSSVKISDWVTDGNKLRISWRCIQNFLPQVRVCMFLELLLCCILASIDMLILNHSTAIRRQPNAKKPITHSGLI